jgi:hypothetical protein
MSSPHQLDDQTRRQVSDIFRRYGVESEVRLAPLASADEVVFVVSTTAAAKLPVASVTRELIDLLDRKVWIATEGADWGGELHPLQ